MTKVVTIDARGLLCPLPVLRLRKALQTHAGGTVRLIADDPAARVDVPHFCAQSGYELITIDENPTELTFTVKAAAPPG